MGERDDSLDETRRRFAAFVDEQHAAPEPDYEQRIMRAFALGRLRPGDDGSLDFERSVAKAMAAARESGVVTPDAIKAIIIGILNDTDYCLCRVPCGLAPCQECEAWGELAERLAEIE